METIALTSIEPILVAVSEAAVQVRQMTDTQKQAFLHRLAQLLEARQAEIVAENEKDLVRMADDDPKKDRLLLNETRIQALAASCRDVALLPDPTGQVLVERTLPNGLHLRKITAPLGVVGVIYEARPNVTIDVAALCLRAGNGVVLRGGSDAWYSNTCLVGLIQEALLAEGLPADAVQLLPPDRELVKELLEAKDYIDILIPRGSQQLIDFVRAHAKVPTIETGAGVCHTYVEKTANQVNAAEIVVNAKVTRPSVCNALDTVLVDAEIAAVFLPQLIEGFLPYEVEIFADATAYAILSQAGYPYLKQAVTADFGREFLSYKCSIKVVHGFEEAIAHIRHYSSKHSEAIVSEAPDLMARFLNEVDAAAVYTNASTRFTDGGVFGLGAEIGISTQKLHARGPFALEKLVTEKWLVQGNGQVR